MVSSAQCARVLIAQLIVQGVREVVLCPGSRSAPLALAVFEAESLHRLRLHVRTDERSAGFLALGLAKVTGAPAAVITTSGTAVGNLLPAVMEASHADVPLVVVTADRPAALVGFGANQTTEQIGIFDGFVRYAARVTSAAHPDTWAAQAAKACVLAATGPVHLNVELDVPLVDDDESEQGRLLPAVVAQASPLLRHRPVSAPPPPLELPAAPRTVIVAGDASGETGRAASRLAVDAGLPLIAEPSSNARTGAELPCGRLALASGLAAEVERVLVFGHPTLSRPVMKLLADPGVEVVVVADDDVDWPDPGHRARLVVPAVTVPPSDPAWLARWVQADAESAARVQAVRDQGLNGWSLAAAVWDAASGGPLLLGASQVIRDADLVGRCPQPPVVFANRGLAGIDGTVSTAMGVALAAGRPTLALMGDLTFLHDSNGLARGVREPRPDLRIVVADDAGGSIFATLEYGGERFAPAFERVFATDAGVDVAALAASYGVPVTTATTLAELAAALSPPVCGVDVVVARLDRSQRRANNAFISGR